MLFRENQLLLKLMGVKIGYLLLLAAKVNPIMWFVFSAHGAQAHPIPHPPAS